MTYRIIPRTEVGLPETVTSSGGTPRPPLHNEPMMIAHYTGNNIDYTGRDAAEVTRQIQRVFATTKPFEYNYVIGQDEDDAIIEYAGKFQAAHSAGENHISFGVLFLLGVGEDPTPIMIDKWRWLRDVLIFEGSLAANVQQIMHFQAPDAATACPGNIRNFWPKFLTPWEPPTTPTITTEEETMEAIFYPAPDPKVGKWHNDATPHLVQWGSGLMTRAGNAHYDLAKLKKVPVLPLDSEDQYLYFIEKNDI